MRMFPFGIHVSWGVGLVLAALTLGGSDSLPWAVAVLGGTVIFGAVISQLVDDLAQQKEAEQATSGH